MSINIQAQGFGVIEGLGRHAYCRLSNPLQGLDKCENRVDVYLRDTNDPEGGTDKTVTTLVA